MFVIVGLGNPGKKFVNTRHNTGWFVLDKLAKELKIKGWQLKKRLKAKILKQVQDDREVVLVKPQTFMNDSGIAVKKVLQYNNLTMQQFDNLYLIHDELDLLLGEYKIQFGRGPAGHKGVESVIKELGTQDFWRVRIGIKKSQKSPASPRRSRGRAKVKSQKSGEEFVLEEFGKKEREILEKVIEKVTEDLISRIK